MGLRVGSHRFSNSEPVPRLVPLMMRPPGGRGRSAAGDAGAPEVFDMALDLRGFGGFRIEGLGLACRVQNSTPGVVAGPFGDLGRTSKSYQSGRLEGLQHAKPKP